jgi:hypothetical protein
MGFGRATVTNDGSVRSELRQVKAEALSHPAALTESCAAASRQFDVALGEVELARIPRQIEVMEREPYAPDQALEIPTEPTFLPVSLSPSPRV